MKFCVWLFSLFLWTNAYCYEKGPEINNIENSTSIKTLTISSSENQNTQIRSINYAKNNQWSSAKIEVTASDVITPPDSFFYSILWIIFIILFILIWIKKFIFNLKYKDDLEEIKNYHKENVLQILKSENEYIIEYNWIYNKWIKIWEKNKNNITQTVYNYTNSLNKLKTRWKNIFKELKKLEIKIPDLKEFWNTIYRLYIPENIRNSIQNEKNKIPLIIKTDEQEIPWEIMHDWESFLSLRFPISRKIMTREIIRKNNFKKNKTPKILFITNPTLDLEWSVIETKEIINKLWSNADITLISWELVTSTKIFSLFWQNNFDIIHYSWHAYFDKKNPDNSWLVLSDSIITAWEIKRVLNWNPFIFLNWCSSWRSEEKDFNSTGEDTTWLASSFLIWWASGVISTLWPVSDIASSSFAIEFYDNFLKNFSVWNALLKAKRETYINFPGDITWASFVYYWEPNLFINRK